MHQILYILSYFLRFFITYLVSYFKILVKRFFDFFSNLLKSILYCLKIMDNVLIQISGKKRVVLFPPSDIDCLYMKGDKSLVLDVDEPDLATYPLFAKATRYECDLMAGDSLFIPAMWLHNVITESFSIGVNVFWKHVDDAFYEKNDVYGNKDLIGGSRALLFADKAVKELNQLPDKTYKEFYTKRIIQVLLDNLQIEK